MFDVQKLIESILAFVNFLVFRIPMTYFVAWFVYKTSGPHYFCIAGTHISNTFNEKCLSWYLEYASKYVTEQNVMNATFVLTLIVSLSLLDILYRVVCKFGSLMPITMVYDFRHVTDDHKRIILEAWRFYAKEFNPPRFIEFAEARASAELWGTLAHSWSGQARSPRH
jgi:hypothetical protein